MKRFILTAILLLPALLACNKSSDNVGEGATSVVLSLEKVDLQVGETATITATVLPASLGMGVTWSVLDDTYAEVNDGVVTAKAEGVTEELKSRDQTEWVQRMNSIRNRAEEMVMNDLIYI